MKKYRVLRRFDSRNEIFIVQKRVFLWFWRDVQAVQIGSSMRVYVPAFATRQNAVSFMLEEEAKKVEDEVIVYA